MAAAVTFLTLVANAGFRSAPSVLIIPLQDAFGWSRDAISLAVSVNVLLFGLTAPFAAALMERFGIRKVVMCAETVVGLGALATIFIQKPWHLVFLWGVIVGIGTGAMALVFAATVANRWFVKRKGLVIGGLTAASATGQLIFLPGLSWLAVNHGWKSVSIVVGSASLIMVPIIFLFLKESPKAIGLNPYGADENYEHPPLMQTNAAKLAIDTLKESLPKRDFW